jgi:hypothetical protein
MGWDINGTKANISVNKVNTINCKQVGKYVMHCGSVDSGACSGGLTFVMNFLST